MEYDSRRVKPGCVFVAMRGETSDGNRFIDRALQAGAVAVVTDSAGESRAKAWPGPSFPTAPRPCASQREFLQASRRADCRHRNNRNQRKSTTAFLIESILTAAGRKSALIGTIEYHVAGRVYPAPHTTPEALELGVSSTKRWSREP